jgi:hypothetical protein
MLNSKLTAASSQSFGTENKCPSSQKVIINKNLLFLFNSFYFVLIFMLCDLEQQECCALPEFYGDQDGGSVLTFRNN